MLDLNDVPVRSPNNPLVKTANLYGCVLTSEIQRHAEQCGINVCTYSLRQDILLKKYHLIQSECNKLNLAETIYLIAQLSQQKVKSLKS